MNLNSILDFTSRLVGADDSGDSVHARARSGDTEVQLQERADGEREIVVLERLGSVPEMNFVNGAVSVDVAVCPECTELNPTRRVDKVESCRDCGASFEVSGNDE